MSSAQLNLKVTMPNKILSFEYVLKCLLEWHKEESHSNNNTNDISILKALKLLFFVSAARTIKDTPNLLLDDVFNDYRAMPFGHVESGILNAIKDRDGRLTYYIINNQSTTLIEGAKPENIKQEIGVDIANEINASIEYLKRKNPRLILMSQFELVDLSHIWFSWKHYFDQGKKVGLRSFPIPSDAIKEEDKIFSLQSF